VGLDWCLCPCNKANPTCTCLLLCNTQCYVRRDVSKITSDTTGEAIVNLNGYHVFTSFDFELEPDYNGQLGSDTKAVFIKNLAVDRVLNQRRLL
jgi:hypothetical protein